MVHYASKWLKAGSLIALGLVVTLVKLADSPLNRQFQKSPKEQKLANPEWDKQTSRRQNQITK